MLINVSSITLFTNFPGWSISSSLQYLISFIFRSQPKCPFSRSVMCLILKSVHSVDIPWVQTTCQMLSLAPKIITTIFALWGSHSNWGNRCVNTKWRCYVINAVMEGNPGCCVSKRLCLGCGWDWEGGSRNIFSNSLPRQLINLWPKFNYQVSNF